MATFGFVGHYLGLEHFCEIRGGPRILLDCMPRHMMKRLISYLPPHQLLELPTFHSQRGTARGIGIVASVIPEHLVTLGEHAFLRRVISAVQMAHRFGAKVVGLAGFTSVAGNEGVEIAKRVPVAVTSGNTFTAALALQGLRKAAGLMGVKFQDATVAVVGATGDIGSICTKVLAREVGRLRLAARNEQHLREFGRQLTKDTGCHVDVVKYVREAVENADLVLSVASAITTVIEPKDLKTGAIVCDVAIPHNVGLEVLRRRKDVLVFEGGMAKMPQDWFAGVKNWNRISPDGISIFGCLAETMILALEGCTESFSLGRGNITVDRIQRIQDAAERHGFSLADFRYGSDIFDEKYIAGVRLTAKRQNSGHPDSAFSEN